MNINTLKSFLLRLRGAFYEPASPVLCSVCGRKLTNKDSIAARMGSCCAKRHHKDVLTFDLFSAGTPGSEA